MQTEVLTDNVYYNSLGDRYSPDKIESVIQMKHRAGLLGYFLAPVTLLIKVLFTSFCPGTGLLCTSVKLPPVKLLFKIALLAESAFAAGTLVKLFMLAFFRSINSFEELQSFAPLSLYSLLNGAAVPPFLTYPLQTLNVFEGGYWLLLAAGLHYFLRKKFGKMLGLVLCSYGLGLVCWMVCMVFLNINFAK
jgi:hypothetical protein